MEPPEVMAPVAGLSHSTFKVRVVAERFTVKEPPEGAYTRYSAPVAIALARQLPVEERLGRGVIFPRLSLPLA